MAKFVKGQPRPPGSGMKKGHVTRKTLERRALEAKPGDSTEMPLDFMLRVMRDPAQAPADRAVMARAAAPYCHAQLQATAVTHLDAQGRPIAPVISVTVLEAPVERPKLDNTGPKDCDVVQ